MSENVHTINIAEVLAPIISTRVAITDLEAMVVAKGTPKVLLDFSRVEFVSRSAAHELLLLKERLANREPKAIVEFINASESVTNMLRVVAANRAVPKEVPATEDIQVVPFEELVSPKPSSLSFWRRLFAH